jgi:hypothetical protein
MALSFWGPFLIVSYPQLLLALFSLHRRPQDPARMRSSAISYGKDDLFGDVVVTPTKETSAVNVTRFISEKLLD